MNPRIIGYDAARAVAVLGMVVVNFSIILEFDDAPVAWPFSWAVNALLGRPAALFVMLAGVGLSLMAAGARRAGYGAAMRHLRIRLVKRSVLLFAAGMVLMEWWASDILHFYAVFLLLGTALVSLSSRWLAGWILFFVSVAAAVINFTEENLLADTLFPALPGFFQPAQLIDELSITGVYPLFPWAAFFIFGMWLGRQDLNDPTLRKRCVIWAASAFCIAGVLSWLCDRWFLDAAMAAQVDPPVYWFEMNPFPSTPFFVLSAGSGAVITIVLCVVAADRLKHSIGLIVIAETGRFSLTLYILHLSIALAGAEWIAGTPVAQTAWGLMLLSGGFFGAGGLVAHVWLRYFSHGPLEWVLRRLSAGPILPRMRRAVTSTPAR